MQAALTGAGVRAVLQVRLDGPEDAAALVETLLQTQRLEVPIRAPRPSATLIDVHIMWQGEIIEINTALDAWYTGGLRLRPLRKDVGSHLLIKLMPDSPRADEERARLERRHGRSGSNPRVPAPAQPGPPRPRRATTAPQRVATAPRPAASGPQRAATAPQPAATAPPAAAPRPTPIPTPAPRPTPTPQAGRLAEPVAQSPSTPVAQPPAPSPTQRASAVSLSGTTERGEAPVFVPRKTRAITGEHAGVAREPLHTPQLGAPAVRPSATTGSLPVIGATLAFLARVPGDARLVCEGMGAGVEAIRAVEAASAEGQVVAFVQPTEVQGARWILLAANGRVERAYVDPESSSAILSLLLQRQGYLDEGQVRAVLQRAADAMLTEEDALSESKLLPASFLLKAARAKLRLLLEKLAVVEEAVWSGMAVDTPVFSVLRAEESELSRFKDLTRALRQRTWNEMESAHQPYLPFCPKLTIGSADLASRFHLSDKTARFLDLCATGEQPLRYIYKITSLTRRETFVVLFALRALGYVSFEEPERDRAFFQRITETVQHRYPHLVRENPYELLELHWTASPFDVSEAVSELEDLLSHATEESVGAEIATRARQLLEYAYAVEERLSTRAGRDAYREATLDEFQLDQGKQLLTSQLEMAVYRRDRDLVERLCEVLTELDAGYGRRKWDEAQAQMRRLE